jgi:Flp pilus assembly protein TadG
VETVTHEYDWMMGGGRVVCDDCSIYTEAGVENYTDIEDKDLVINAAKANESNCKLTDGTLVTAPGALFDNVTLIAGYCFPRELFYPATYNGEEVQFWDADWLAAHPEVETIRTANKITYDTSIRTAGLYYNMPNYTGCRTIDSMLYHQGKGRVEYDQNRRNITYFEETKTIGNEMLWNYFRPGVEHTYGEPFTYTTTETVHHDATYETKTVHHAAVTHTEKITHPATTYTQITTTTTYTCKNCKYSYSETKTTTKK